MKKIILNGAEITTREELHKTMSRELDLPAWYGNNLDALYDCLTDLREEVLIYVEHVETMEKFLDGYAGRFMRVLYAASLENPRIHLSKNYNKEAHGKH